MDLEFPFCEIPIGFLKQEEEKIIRIENERKQNSQKKFIQARPNFRKFLMVKPMISETSFYEGGSRRKYAFQTMPRKRGNVAS